VTQRIELKIVCLRNKLGIALDKIILNQIYPLTPYYFWPKTEAWDQLKLELESKTWLTKSERIKVLNLTTEIMNYWRQFKNVDRFETMVENFSIVKIVKASN
jgi:30S ribosomal protein 3